MSQINPLDATRPDPTRPDRTRSGPASEVAQLPGHVPVEPLLTLAELAAHLCVPPQTLYDLRTKGRGPRGFKVGRRLHFRLSEVEAWLRHLEEADTSSPDHVPARAERAASRKDPS